MTLASLKPDERRTIRIGLLLLALGGIWRFGVQPYWSSLNETRERLLVERAALMRERGTVATAQQNPELRRMTDSVLHLIEPRLFSGSDDVIASSELASYLGDLAHAHHVWLQDAATRPVSSTISGVRTLHVDVRGESDLEGIVAFLQALEQGNKLVRVERLDLSKGLSGPGNEHAETLVLSATIAGYAMGTSSTVPAGSR